jgi:hypothetical protein
MLKRVIMYVGKYLKGFILSDFSLLKTPTTRRCLCEVLPKIEKVTG